MAYAGATGSVVNGEIYISLYCLRKIKKLLRNFEIFVLSFVYDNSYHVSHARFLSVLYFYISAKSMESLREVLPNRKS